MDESIDLKKTSQYPGTAHPAFVEDNPDVLSSKFVKEENLCGQKILLKEFQEVLDLNHKNPFPRSSRMTTNELLAKEKADILLKGLNQAAKVRAKIDAEEAEKVVAHRAENDELIKKLTDEAKEALQEQPVLRPDPIPVTQEYPDLLGDEEQKKVLELNEEKVLQKCLDEDIPIIRCAQTEACGIDGSGNVVDDMLILAGLAKDKHEIEKTGSRKTVRPWREWSSGSKKKKKKWQEPPQSVEEYFGVDNGCHWDEQVKKCPALGDPDSLFQKMGDIFGKEWGTGKSQPESELTDEILKELNRLLECKELTASYDDDRLTINRENPKNGLPTKITTNDIGKAYDGLTALTGRAAAVRTVAKVLATKVNSLF